MPSHTQGTMELAPGDAVQVSIFATHERLTALVLATSPTHLYAVYFVTFGSSASLPQEMEPMAQSYYPVAPATGHKPYPTPLDKISLPQDFDQRPKWISLRDPQVIKKSEAQFAGLSVDGRCLATVRSAMTALEVESGRNSPSPRGDRSALILFSDQDKPSARPPGANPSMGLVTQRSASRRLPPPSMMQLYSPGPPTASRALTASSLTAISNATSVELSRAPPPASRPGSSAAPHPSIAAPPSLGPWTTSAAEHDRPPKDDSKATSQPPMPPQDDPFGLYAKRTALPLPFGRFTTAADYAAISAKAA